MTTAVKHTVSLPVEVLTAAIRVRLEQLAKEALLAFSHPDDPYWNFESEAVLIKRQAAWRAQYADTPMGKWLARIQERIEDELDELDRLLILSETNARYGDQTVELPLDEHQSLIRLANSLAQTEIHGAMLTANTTELKTAADAFLARAHEWQMQRRQALLEQARQARILRFFTRESAEERAQALYEIHPQPWDELTHPLRRLAKAVVQEPTTNAEHHVSMRQYFMMAIGKVIAQQSTPVRSTP